MTIQRFAVIGNPIDHSLSPIIHHYFAKCIAYPMTYEKIQGDEHHVESQIITFFNQGGKGLNITLPFKERAYRLADVVTERCRDAKAANTLWMKNNQLYADNTDGIGFIRDITHFVPLVKKSILIIGAGGAARGIIPALLRQPLIDLTVVNRSPSNLIHLKQDFPTIETMVLSELRQSHFDMIIHATAAKELSLPDELWQHFPFCYDLNYTLNGLTPFVKKARSFGCKAEDGLGMLIQQAAESFEIWVSD